MTRSPFVLLVAAGALGLLLAPRPAAGDPPKRTLAELIAIARQRAPTVAAAEAQVDIRKWQRSGAIRNWLPSGELRGVLTLSTPITCYPSTEFCEKTNIANVAQWQGISGVAGEINLTLTQPLYTFGKIEHGTRAAEHGIEVEKQRVEIARAETELNVARAYWGLKGSRTALATAVDARDQLAAWVKKIEDDLDLDKPKYNFNINDLQRLKVGVSQIDLVVADMTRNAGIAFNGLRAAVGEYSEIDDAELEPVEIVERPLEYYQRAALDARPEIKALAAGVKARTELARFRRAEMLPDLAVVGTVGYRGAMGVEEPQNAFLNHLNPGLVWGGALAVRQPMDLFVRHARLEEAHAETRALLAQQQLALTGIGFEIAQAWENLGEARRRLDAADRGQRTARGWLTAVQQNIDLGTAEARDLVDAARSYYELRLRFYQAIYDVNLNVFVLRKAAAVEVAK